MKTDPSCKFGQNLLNSFVSRAKIKKKILLYSYLLNTLTAPLTAKYKLIKAKIIYLESEWKSASFSVGLMYVALEMKNNGF